MKPVVIFSGYQRAHTVRWPHYAELAFANTDKAESIARAFASGKVKRVIVCHTSCPANAVKVLRRHGVQTIPWGEDVQKLALELPDVLARSGFRPPAAPETESLKLADAINEAQEAADRAAHSAEAMPEPPPVTLLRAKPDAPLAAGLTPPRRPREWEAEDVAAILEAVRYADGDAARFVEGYHLQREATRPVLQLYAKLVEIGTQRGLDLAPELLRGLRVMAGLESPASPPSLPAVAVDVQALLRAAMSEVVRHQPQASNPSPPAVPPPLPAAAPAALEAPASASRASTAPEPTSPAPHGVRMRRRPVTVPAALESPPRRTTQPAVDAYEEDEEREPRPNANHSVRLNGSPATNYPVPPDGSYRPDGLHRLRRELHAAVQQGALSKEGAFDILLILDQERAS